MLATSIWVLCTCSTFSILFPDLPQNLVSSDGQQATEPAGLHCASCFVLLLRQSWSFVSHSIFFGWVIFRFFLSAHKVQGFFFLMGPCKIFCIFLNLEVAAIHHRCANLSCRRKYHAICAGYTNQPQVDE
jgi:hypothetical protein